MEKRTKKPYLRLADSEVSDPGSTLLGRLIGDFASASVDLLPKMDVTLSTAGCRNSGKKVASLKSSPGSPLQIWTGVNYRPCLQHAKIVGLVLLVCVMAGFSSAYQHTYNLSVLHLALRRMPHESKTWIFRIPTISCM